MKRELVYSIILATTTFISGLLIGYYVIGVQTEKLWIRYENVRTLVDSALYYLQDAKYTCNQEDLQILGKKVDIIGYEVSLLENSQLKNNADMKLQLLKSQYFNLQYLHYLLAKEMMYNCQNSDIVIIFYFYESDDACKICKNQGYQLSHLKKRHPEEILVYSFDIKYPNYFIYYYKEKYNITETPYLIIMTRNKTITIGNYATWQELEKIIYE